MDDEKRKELESGVERCIFVYALVLSCVALIGGCSGSEPDTIPTLISSAVVDASPGGIWVGLDSSGGLVRTVATEDGRFHLVDQFRNQGSGFLSVSNGTEVFADFQLVTELGVGFSDGSTLADCTLSGTVSERRTMSIIVDCTTTAGLQFRISAPLDYDAVYERPSSLSTIAGVYDAGFGIVTTIAADGTIFEQDPVFGCVINGQVELIDGAFNVYDIRFGYSGCTGQFGILNGTSYVGLGTLDDTVAPEVLEITATGEVAGRLASVVSARERL